MPWHINHSEAELLISALQNFAMAFVAYQKLGFGVDFENGETLLRFYDSEADMWYNATVTMPLAPFILPKLAITDDILIANLKKKKKNRTKLGFAIVYIPMPIQENKNERPKVPRMAVLADMDNGGLIDQATDMEFETIGNAVIQLFTRYIENNGKPESIAIADEDANDIIEDFAKKLGIKLVEDKRLLALGKLVTDMIDMTS
jgi:hypothetical protein